MAIRLVLIVFVLAPLMLFGQTPTDNNKAVKIEFLQSLNKLETAFQKDREG